MGYVVKYSELFTFQDNRSEEDNARVDGGQVRNRLEITELAKFDGGLFGAIIL